MATQKLFINQWGEKFIAKSIKELKSVYGIQGRVSKMYHDDVNGKTWHTGYVVGRHWFAVHVLTPLRKPA